MDTLQEAINGVLEVMTFLKEMNDIHTDGDDPPDMDIMCDVDPVGSEGFCELEETMEIAQDLLNALLRMKVIGG